MPVPKPATGEIMDRIADLSADQGWNDFSVKRLQSEIDKLRRVDAADAYMLDGILATHLRDLDAAKGAYEKARKLAPWEEVILWNNSASLTNFAQYHEALEPVEKMLTAGFVGPSHVEAALWLSLVTMQLDTFDRFDQAYGGNVREGEIYESVDWMRQDARVIRSFLSGTPTSDKDLERLYRHVQQVLVDHDEITLRLDAKVNDFYGQHVLHLDYWVERAPKGVIDMNQALLDQVAGDEEFEHWDRLIASFVCARHDERPETDGLHSKVAYAGYT